MVDLHEKLSEKGWHPEHIEHAHRIIEEGKTHDKSGTAKDMSRLLYLIVLLVLMICNLLIAIFLVPFLLVLNDIILYFIVGLLGLVFGGFFALLIWDIEHLESHHHLLAAIFIPLVAVINLVIMSRAADKIAAFMQLEISENPLITGLIYVVAFLIPYLFVLFKK